MALLYRNAKIEDIPKLKQILEQAIAYLGSQGIPQWQRGQFGAMEIRQAIEASQAYILYPEYEGREIVAFMVLSPEDRDYERPMLEGKWAHQGNYLAMHRLMMNPAYRGKGLADAFFIAAKAIALKQGVALLRIDTHPKNRVMQRVILRQDFTYCGRLRLAADNSIRLAYEKRIIPSNQPMSQVISGGCHGSMAPEEITGPQPCRPLQAKEGGI